MARDLEKQKAAKRAWYYRNRATVILNNKQRREDMWTLLIEAKDKPCTDCHQRFPHFCMDFDHLDPETKIDHVSRLVRSTGINKLRAEIEKCEIVCAVCHRVRTYNRLHTPVG